MGNNSSILDLHRKFSIEANGELALDVTHDISFDNLVKLTDKEYGAMKYINACAFACN